MPDLRRVSTIVAPAVALTAAAAPPAVAASTPAACSASRITVTVQTGAAAGGHVGFLVHVNNTSRSACTTTGYPQATLLGSAGQVLRRAKPSLRGYLGGLKSETTPPVLTLEPGEEATALVETTDVTAAEPCATATTAKIALPGTTATVSRPFHLLECDVAWVHPELAGSAGTG